jgi:hypothetical protein
VSGVEDVELVCEFRGSQGSGLFDPASMRLVRLDRESKPRARRDDEQTRLIQNDYGRTVPLFMNISIEPTRSRTGSAIALGFAMISTVIAGPRGLLQAADSSPAAAAPLPVYELTLGQDEWEKLRRAPRSEERHPAKFAASGMEYSVGVRYRGDWARTWLKKPLKIFFEKDKDLDGQRVLNLNSNWRDPAFIREQLAYHIYDACGVPAPRTRMVKLNLNGEFHGVFLQVEQPEKAFLKRVGLKGAVVYKCNSHQLRSDESDLGEEALFRANYEKETRKDEDYSDLQSFCHELATTKDVAGFFGTRIDWIATSTSSPAISSCRTGTGSPKTISWSTTSLDRKSG